MLWFRHFSDFHKSELMSELLDKFGGDGYSAWWIILEEIAHLMDDSDRCSARFSLKVWATSTRLSSKKFQNIVKFLEKKEVFSLDFNEGYLTIKCPILLKHRDEWTKKKIREGQKTPELLRTESGLNLEKLRTNSASESESESDTETDKEYICPNPPKTPVLDVSSSSDFFAFFDDFWRHYPRKEAKADAKKAWKQMKASQKWDVILADLQTKRWERGTFTPLAATYLRGNRWEDEDIKPSATHRGYETLQEANKRAGEEFMAMVLAEEAEKAARGEKH